MKTNENTVPADGNLFALLALPDSDDLHAKAQLANAIHRTLSERGLTQSEAAGLMGTTQAKVSDIVRCKLDGFSIDRLFRFLNALGQDVEILIAPKPMNREARVHVASIGGPR
ncbi:MAG: XRE family transcriptional regulator [Candidatus Hydrogenedentes bacterium]|nr:XRE family transcriptional regulator [Candidatus Hydrogenedentota bacterium]